MRSGGIAPDLAAPTAALFPMRIYTEDEVQELLRRAAAMQATSPARTGLTLDEIRQAASSAGIDPDFVTAAATQPATASPTESEPGRGFWGGPYTITRERTVRHGLDDDAWAEIVGELRRTYGVTGDVSETGSMRDWSNGMTSAGSSYYYQRLSATPRRGHTTLLVEHKLHNEAALYVLPMMACVAVVLTGAIAAIGEISILPFLVSVIALVASFLLARRLFASSSRKAGRKASDVLDRIDARLDDLRADASPVADATGTPALALPDEEATGDAEDAAPALARRAAHRA